ncbi:MAG: hypothetical protein ACRDCE_08820 [Cetobacterium sp.]|uniref:hypothetical protein n=1 Tax=Cetobacterium sp. TaxID=2071632 RepID=UPI003EE647AF
MNVNPNDLVLDMNSFSFDDIDNSDIIESPEQYAANNPAKRDMPIREKDPIMQMNGEGMTDIDFDDIMDDEEDFLEDMLEDAEDGGIPVEGFEEITEALGKLDTVPDNYELNFGTTTVKKGELVELMNTREQVMKTREAIDTFAKGLVEKENIINASFEVAKTETDKQLEHVYSMLNDPDKWNSSTDVAQLQRARIQLEARKKELTAKNEEARAAISEQRQQAMVFNIQKVVKEMGGDAPLKSAAKYAEAKGMNLDAIVQGLTPAMVEALNNAAKYEELVNKNKSRLEQASKSNRARSRSFRSQNTAKKAPDLKARAYQAYKAGKMDSSDFFNYLDD